VDEDGTVSSYEYAVLIYTHETNWNDIKDTPVTTRPEQTWTHRYELWLPGVAEAKVYADEPNYVDILNDMGRQGWRMASLGTAKNSTY
jgi:hypothetical protein